MADLTTSFMGIELRNPIVVGASHLTGTVRKIRACERAGAGALVTQTIFEQRVQQESRRLMATMRSPANSNGEAVLDELSSNFTIDEYIKLVEEAKKAVSIPVIASIHCRSPRSWEEYAARLEAVGADAIEINLFDLDASPEREGAQVERGYLDIARRVARKVKLPVAAKLGFAVSNPAALVAHLQEAGVAGAVLFNRFYGPDIDIERLKLTPSPILSSESEALHALRWIGILSSQTALDFAATGGIHSAETAIKLLLAGARTVEMCSAFYIEGLEHIAKVTAELEAWMTRRKFQSLAEVTAQLNQDRSKKARLYESAQYVDLQRSRR